MEDWSHELFIREVKPEWGNSPKSKILVVTRDKNKDNGLIEKCRADSRTNHMDIRVTEWVDYPNLEKEIYPNDAWRPIVVVITFNGVESDGIFGGLQADMGADYQKGPKFNFKILHLFNIFNPEQCILLSTTITNARAVKQRLRAARLENKPTTRVLVIAGGHGGIKEDGTKQPLEHNGPTGFTRYDLLVPKFYREDCVTVGVAQRSGTKQDGLSNPV
jgi:N-acetylmuramoyl-L-alanine amidase